jgi:hypothetical protein
MKQEQRVDIPNEREQRRSVANGISMPRDITQAKCQRGLEIATNKSVVSGGVIIFY